MYVVLTECTTTLLQTAILGKAKFNERQEGRLHLSAATRNAIMTFNRYELLLDSIDEHFQDVAPPPVLRQVRCNRSAVTLLRQYSWFSFSFLFLLTLLLFYLFSVSFFILLPFFPSSLFF